jgi:phytanoyl-CoA hydroxylase
LTSALGSRRLQFWEEEGFLVIPGFFSDEEVEAVQAATDCAWAEQAGHVVVDDLVTGRRSRLDEVGSGESNEHHFKVNDLYLTEPRMRSAALSERLGLVLSELLGDEPVICNTLNFDKGSQQPDHLDTLYMTPASDLGLVATWMALEDADDAAGPLRYWPGSNTIAPFRFSTGSMHEHKPELPRWSEYMAGEVERMGLEQQRFVASRGDLFIWHALLLHGGCPISDYSLTRQSLVTHFWTLSDCEAAGQDLRPTPGGWWMQKNALRVDLPTAEPALATTALAPGVVDEPDLFDRLTQLEHARD